MKYIVTDKGPIDRLGPGTDVTRLYSPDVLKRLVQEGYVKQEKPKGEPCPPSKASTPKSS